MKKFKKCLIVACVCIIAGFGLSIKTKAAPSFYVVESTHLLTYPFDTDMFIISGDILPTTLQASNFNNYGVILMSDEGFPIGGGWFSDHIVNGDAEIYTGMTLGPTGEPVQLLLMYDSVLNLTYVSLRMNGVSIVSPDDGYFLDIIRSINSYNCPTCPENPECPECPDTEVGSFSQFLIEGVGGFLNFEIIPGWSLISILSVFLAIALVVIILRYFAGG